MALTKSKNDVLQGTLTLLILRALSHGKLHGYGITLFVEKASDELLRVEEGSLYPALHRLEEQGAIKAEWGMTEFNRRARFYALTAQGRKLLDAELQSWERLTKGVGKVLRYA
jgi:transcriptional regulator